MSQPSPNALSVEANQAVRELLASLIEIKQFVGFQYASWCTSGPSIEADIALAGMAQEESGHAAALGALLEDPSTDKDALVTWASWSEKAGGMIDDWPLMIVTCLARDAAATATLEALKGARDARLAQRATKMLQEERFHLMFGMETVRSFAALSPKARRDLGDCYRRALAEAENQLGSIDKLSRLASLGVVSADAMEARRNSLENLSRRLNDVWA